MLKHRRMAKCVGRIFNGVYDLDWGMGTMPDNLKKWI